MQQRRRVVVTGMSLVTPLGVGVQECWANLKDGKCGIVSVADLPDYEYLPAKIGGRIPAHFDPKKYETSVTRILWYSQKFLVR